MVSRVAFGKVVLIISVVPVDLPVTKFFVLDLCLLNPL